MFLGEDPQTTRFGSEILPIFKVLRLVSMVHHEREKK